MNRRKKGNAASKARIKKANAKLATNTKPKYISKAERAKLELESTSAAVTADGNAVHVS
ncbi:MAG: DUF2986 domain-containing protein [Gammaproteobacteria bacterium]|mgnify:CR=1 FL=1|jgi:hypothetical protein|nr:DUF2986 domain-containing protein [Zhongshania sp.]MBU0538552.1 DUF2986 domain-containing protein [Gammaproteobacteria bacterium]MBU1831342.1 DUF2986 domain-containing protein [Gammaproteobacteria bacterium]